MHKLKMSFCLSLIAGLIVIGLCGQSAGAQEANPHAVSLYNLGLTAFKEGSPESAVIFFKRATDIDPNLADAHYNLGVIYQSQRRFKEAIPRFEEVLRIKPGDADAHFQLGAILQDSGRFSEAKDHLSQIPPSSPHFQEAQTRLNQLNNQSAGAVGTMPGQGQVSQAQINQSPLGQSPLSQLPAQPVQTTTAPYQGQQPNYAGQPTAPSIPSSMPATGLAAMAGQQVAPLTGNVPVQGEKAADTAVPAAPNPVPVLPNSTLRVVATGFNAPSGLAFDRMGNLYVANYVSDTIDRIAPDGSRSQFAIGANLKGPIGLVADDLGNLYVANYNGGTIARISPAGITTIIATGFRKPYYLTLDSEGNLYISQQEDNSIVRLVLPKPLGAKVR